MSQNWSIELNSPHIERFIADHGLKIYDIRVQPFLFADVAWQQIDDAWEIKLSSGMYHDGPAEESILHALAALSRRDHPWFEETPAAEFDQLTKRQLDERRNLNPEEREFYSRTIVAIDRALCSALDLYYLLSRGYLEVDRLRSLAEYRSRNFLSSSGAIEFLASMAMLKVAGGMVAELYDVLIRNKWYTLLPVLDRIEDCVRSSRVVHDDSLFVFDRVLPYCREQSFLDTIAVLRRNAIGPRDDSELDFDVAISYAGADRAIAEPLAAALVRDRLSVFYDRNLEPELWGKELHRHLTDVYQRRARFCVMLISRNYAMNIWPTVERRAAVARAVSENRDYILPLRLDDTSVPGLPATIVYVDYRNRTQEEICELLVQRIRRVK